MADGIRDSTLVDFQAFTGIEDIETCVAILEQHDWRLETAVNSILQDPASATINPVPPSNATAGETTEMADCNMDLEKMEGFTTDDPALVVEGASAAGPSTSFSSRSTTRMLHFQVEYRDKTIPVILPDTETIGKIKETLSVELSIPVDQQELKGLIKRKVEDRTVLRDLHLPKQNRLYLLTPQITNPTLTRPKPVVIEDPCEMFDREYTLNIKYLDGSKYQLFPLRFQGSKSVREIKQAVFVLTDVPSRFQVWLGWPEDTQDEELLGRTGISYPSHDLEMRQASSSSSHPKTKVTVEEAVMEIDSSDDETNMEPYSLDDEIFAPEADLPQSRKHEPLMPETVSDETDALEHFTKEFKERYGDCHPVFYIGSLDDAIRDALQVKAKDRKLLAIYLHHEESIFSNVFCSQLLCSEGIVNYLSSNCITWAWDMTFEANRARLITVATRHFGSVAASQIRNYRTDQLPALLLITRSRATNEVVDVIQGHVTLDELMTRLIHSVEVFTEQQEADMLEEREREAREQIKLEQDEAYQESLAADRAKAEAAKIENERLQAEQEKVMQAQMEEEQKRQEEEAVKEAIRASLQKSLPDEPPENCKDPVSRIRFRLPTGEIATRRFLASETVQTVLHFLTAKGFHTEEYKVLSTFPRRDITQLDGQLSLKDAKLFPQETLILEEKS